MADVISAEPLVGEERIAAANGIEIAYEELGDPSGEPLVLIMGLATQMISGTSSSASCWASAATG